MAKLRMSSETYENYFGSDKPVKSLYGHRIVINPYPYHLYVTSGPLKDAKAYVLNTQPGTSWMILSSLDIEEKYLVHECCHVLDNLDEFIGDTLRGEAKAYLSQWLFESVKKTIIKLKKLDKH